jgi:hypothetical protein
MMYIYRPGDRVSALEFGSIFTPESYVHVKLPDCFFAAGGILIDKERHVSTAPGLIVPLSSPPPLLLNLNFFLFNLHVIIMI